MVRRLVWAFRRLFFKSVPNEWDFPQAYELDEATSLVVVAFLLPIWAYAAFTLKTGSGPGFAAGAAFCAVAMARACAIVDGGVLVELSYPPAFCSIALTLVNAAIGLESMVAAGWRPETWTPPERILIFLVAWCMISEILLTVVSRLFGYVAMILSTWFAILVFFSLSAAWPAFAAALKAIAVTLTVFSLGSYAASTTMAVTRGSLFYAFTPLPFVRYVTMQTRNIRTELGEDLEALPCAGRKAAIKNAAAAMARDARPGRLYVMETHERFAEIFSRNADVRTLLNTAGAETSELHRSLRNLYAGVERGGKACGENCPRLAGGNCLAAGTSERRIFLWIFVVEEKR